MKEKQLKWWKSWRDFLLQNKNKQRNDQKTPTKYRIFLMFHEPEMSEREKNNQQQYLRNKKTESFVEGCFICI